MFCLYVARSIFPDQQKLRNSFFSEEVSRKIFEYCHDGTLKRSNWFFFNDILSQSHSTQNRELDNGINKRYPIFEIQQ